MLIFRWIVLLLLVAGVLCFAMYIGTGQTRWRRLGLLIVKWTVIAGLGLFTEDGERRSLEVFRNWQPPAGAEFQGFYGFVDGTGGVAIIEADSAATVARTTAPWTPWLAFQVTPIIPIEEAVAIAGEAVGFRDSVS